MWITVSEDRLILEEEHLGRRWLILIALVFAGMGLTPAIHTIATEGSVVGPAIGGCCMVSFIFYMPYLAVLAMSRYRVVVIDPVAEVLEGHVVPRLFARRVTRVPFAKIEWILCERIPDSDGPDGIIITLTHDGATLPLIKRSAWSDEVVARLAELFGEKLIRRG